MKRMMGCGEDLTSLMSPLRRFSNSPLTPCSGLKECEVEAVHLHILERRRNVSLAHAQREAFDDRGFADACFASHDGLFWRRRMRMSMT